MRRRVRERPQETRLHRDVDLLAAAGRLAIVMRDERAGGRVHPRPHRRLGKRDAQGRAARLADQRHEPAHGHRDEVRAAVAGVRPGLPEGRDRREDQPGVRLAQRSVAKLPRVQVAGGKRLDENVRTLRQAAQEVPPPRGVDGEGDPPLAGVVGKPGEVVGRIGIIPAEDAHAPSRVPLGRLDLDDVRAEVPEDAAAQPAGAIGEIEDAVRGQRPPVAGSFPGGPRRPVLVDHRTRGPWDAWALPTRFAK